MVDKINPRERKVKFHYDSTTGLLGVLEHCSGNFVSGLTELCHHSRSDTDKKYGEGDSENTLLDSQAKLVQYIERALSDPKCSEGTYRVDIRDELIQLVARAEQFDWRDADKMAEFENYCKERVRAIRLTVYHR